MQATNTKTKNTKERTKKMDRPHYYGSASVDTEKYALEYKYLKLLANQFRNIAETSTEIINLEAILNLPKGTEHFITDVHGEYPAFNHVLRNGSGTIRDRIEDLFKDRLTEAERKELATVIYYPNEKIDLMSQNGKVNINDKLKVIMHRLVELCSLVSAKYTRSKVKKAMSEDFQFILQELIYDRHDLSNRTEYTDTIIDTIINIGRGKYFIIAISDLIQRLVVDKLHILGDIFDRGPSPHLIMNTLEKYHDVDIQWGNHDILWMGAAMGNEACIANVVRICTRYCNNDILEEAYGISLLDLITFSMQVYGEDECKCFYPKEGEKTRFVARIHKAISVIQYKLEGQIIERNPDFDMDDRNMLKMIDYKRGVITLDGIEYELNDKNFPTIDPANPLELTPEEKSIVEHLKKLFLKSEILQRHLNFLITKGSLYLKSNNNLLYHGCIPVDENGRLKSVEIEGKKLRGKALFDTFDLKVREAFFGKNEPSKHDKNRDFMWYLWCGPNSPLFGKHAMKTFERALITDKITHKEIKDPYYEHYNNVKTCEMILRDFGLEPNTSHIVNGHVPVKVKKGESPIKAEGRLFVIDGGFSKAYQSETGIAGYTLVSNSWGIKIVSHAPFESTEKAILEEVDIVSSARLVDVATKRVRVRDTDNGKELISQVNELKKLLNAYRKGIIKPKFIKRY